MIEKLLAITDSFIDNNLFLYDVFAKQIILEENKSKFAPPERYFEVGPIEGNEDYYKDTYWVEYPKEVIDFSYSYEESWNKNPRFIELLYSYFESHGLPRKAYSLKRRLYPRKRFKELLKKYFYFKGE